MEGSGGYSGRRVSYSPHHLRSADQLRAVLGTALRGPGLGPGSIRPVAGNPEPRLGARTTGRRSYRRPVRLGTGTGFRWRGVCPRRGTDGGERHPANTTPDGRCAGRPRALRWVVHHRDSGPRTPGTRRSPLVGYGYGDRRGLSRTVPVRPARAGVYLRLRLGDRPGDARRVRRR